jgi:hypothetical protein
MTLIEDTTMLWDEYCLIRLSIQYRVRAIPLVWRVLRHSSKWGGIKNWQTLAQRLKALRPHTERLSVPRIIHEGLPIFFSQVLSSVRFEVYQGMLKRAAFLGSNRVISAVSGRPRQCLY